MTFRASGYGIDTAGWNDGDTVTIDLNGHAITYGEGTVIAASIDGSQMGYKVGADSTIYNSNAGHSAILGPNPPGSTEDFPEANFTGAQAGNLNVVITSSSGRGTIRSGNGAGLVGCIALNIGQSWKSCVVENVDIEVDASHSYAIYHGANTEIRNVTIDTVPYEVLNRHQGPAEIRSWYGIAGPLVVHDCTITRARERSHKQFRHYARNWGCRGIWQHHY
jgi:hypothetical protein